MFKRRFQKTSIWISGIMDPDRNKNMLLTDNQKKAIAICQKMINDPSSELLITTTSDKRYIKNGSYFVVITQEGVHVVNHVYGYDVRLYGRKFTNIQKMFDKRLDKDRMQMEDEIRNNIKHSLDKVLEKLKAKQNKLKEKQNGNDQSN